MHGKADDTGRLAPAKEDNAAIAFILIVIMLFAELACSAFTDHKCAIFPAYQLGCKDKIVTWEHGYIDRTGKEVIPCIYDETRAFSENAAIVKKDIENDSPNGWWSDYAIIAVDYYYAGGPSIAYYSDIVIRK